MANIYSSIISGMMDAFASVISNNLNVIMKVLTSITILLTIPNIVFSFYGMNVLHLPLDQFWWFPLCLSVVLIGVIAVVLKRKDLF
jgi:magnesium transporter